MLIEVVLDQLYHVVDRIIDGIASGEPVALYVRYGAYWAATYFAIRLAVRIARSGLVGLIDRLPDSADRIAARDRVADELAREFEPDNCALLRSDIAAGNHPPDGADPKTLRRYQLGGRLQAPVDAKTLRRWARVDCWKIRSRRYVASVASLVARPALVLSAAAVVWVRPSRTLQTVVEQRYSQVASAFDNGTITRSWPVAVFALTVVIVFASSSGLLDRIRARDEAAKDANRLLAELCGALIRVRYRMYKWSQWLEWRAPHALLAERVESFTHHVYTARRGGGICPVSERHAHRVTRPRITSELAYFETEIGQALDDLHDACQKIVRAGLVQVCRRLTAGVWHSTFELGLFVDRVQAQRSGDDVQFVTPATIRRMLDRPVFGWNDADGTIVDDDGEAAKVERQKQHAAEEDAFAFQAHLADLISKMVVVDHHCGVVTQHLNRRMRGSSLTRAASAFAK